MLQNAAAIVPATEPDPIPLVGRTPRTPFPVDAFPPTIAAMVTAVAEATQSDPAMAATTALSVLAAAAGGRCEVEARHGWREILALMTATVANPGERKSAVHAAMTHPLLEAEKEMAESGTAARLEAETQLQIAAKASEKARTAAGHADPGNRDALTADAIAAAMMAEAITVPPIPRIIADDVTPEATASLLAEQGGRLAIMSAEGGIFDIIAGRYSASVPNLDVFLKGHAGDPLRVDRRGREPEYVRRPALTVGLMIQPAVLSSIGRHKSFRGRGLLARFLYAQPVSKVGRRRSDADPVPPEIEEAYATTVNGLVHGLSGWAGDPAILTLDVDAQATVVRMLQHIEPQLAPNGELGTLADWGSKYAGAVLRIAGLLHLADHGADVAIRRQINTATLVRAGTIGGYFREQAIHAFTEMQVDEATADAVYLLQRISVHPEDEISVRDAQRLAQRFKAREEIEVPLYRLVDAGYLIPIEETHDGPGRSPSPRFTIHPAAREQRD